MTAHLRDTPCVRPLLAVLPGRGTAQTWGDEVYFELPIKAALEADAASHYARLLRAARIDQSAEPAT